MNASTKATTTTTTVSTIVTTLAAILLTMGLVPVSSAQNSNDVTENAIEVITIVGKRPAATAASVCIHEVFERSAAHRDSNAGEEASAARTERMINFRQNIKRCFNQGVTSQDAQS
jgi:hypothetical protein